MFPFQCVLCFTFLLVDFLWRPTDLSKCPISYPTNSFVVSFRVDDHCCKMN